MDSPLSIDSVPSSSTPSAWYPDVPLTPKVLEKRNCCYVQADVVPTEGATVTETHGTLSFHDSGSAVNVGYDLPYDISSGKDQTANSDLSEFLSRPVRIASFNWAEADVVGTTRSFSPWRLFFDNARVKFKINNFAFLQCKLKVKILINGTPFYYGRMIAAYQPLPSFTPSRITIDAGNRHLIPVSQRPHLWVTPQDENAGEMSLPFFWPRNWLNVQQGGDFTDMGRLDFINYTLLRSANGVSSTGVTVSVYAWAEDVKLSGPTIGLALQSDEHEVQADEYGQGPVSGVASAIASGATWFEKIPIIGRFATATRIGASAVSGIASLFGWTNVPVIADVQPYKPTAFAALASSEIGFPLEKLTLDPKNELTVDPSVCGVSGEDEMLISSIVQRQSYLTSTEWATTDAVDKILFTGKVNPRQYDTGSGSNPNVYLTPLYWGTLPFRSWRGDIIYTFRVVKSPFHKGRIRITYDPAGIVGSNIITDATTGNVVTTVMMDLSGDAEAELVIPYQQSLAFMENLDATNSSSLQWTTSSTPNFAYNNTQDNGTITLRVLTALTAPVVAAPLTIQVFVRAGPTFEVANPRPLPRNLSVFSVQSDEHSEEHTSDELVMGKMPDTEDNKYLINFGQNIKSFRQLLRRSSLVSISTLTSAADSSFYTARKQVSKIPGYYGYDPNGINSAKGLVVPASNFNFNYSYICPLTWLLPGYVAYRGSAIWTFNASAKEPITSVRAIRGNTLYDTASSFEAVNSFTSGTNSYNARVFMEGTQNGCSAQGLTNQLTNAGLSLLLPNQSNYRFCTTNPVTATSPSALDGSSGDILRLDMDGINVNTTPITLWSYHAIGTDFSAIFFLNVPTFVLYSANPTAN